MVFLQYDGAAIRGRLDFVAADADLAADAQLGAGDRLAAVVEIDGVAVGGKLQRRLAGAAAGERRDFDRGFGDLQNRPQVDIARCPRRFVLAAGKIQAQRQKQE